MLIENCGKYIVFYDDTKPIYHQRFSILHEPGHALLGHKMNLPKSAPLYAKQEVESNMLTAQLLMPEQVINVLRKRGKFINNNFLQKTFDVSAEASEKRIQTLNKLARIRRSGEEHFFDESILLKYQKFIDAIAPKSFYDEEYDFDT